MKKCPQCGNDIASNIKSCSHCGYSSEHINKVYEYGNTGKKKTNTSTVILIVILCVFFGPLAVIIFVAAGILTVSFGGVLTNMDECSFLCNGEYTEKSNTCYCNNGDIYSKNGVQLNNDSNDNSDNNFDSSKIHLAPTDTKEWEDDIFLDEVVVTVLCESDNYLCESYTSIIYDSALKNGYKLYIFNVDQLSYEDRNYLINREVLTTFNDIYPYTFITKDKKLIASKSGLIYENDLKYFLEDAGVIEYNY